MPIEINGQIYYKTLIYKKDRRRWFGVNATAAGAELISTIMVILSEIIEAIADAIYTAAQNSTQMMALANGIFGN